MSKTNRTLALVAVVLVVLSVWSYRQSVSRADRFERGQKLLQSLDLDQIAAIALTKGGESVNLHRDGDHFQVVEEHGYPARNEAVNRLLRDLLEISLEKPVGSGDKLVEELGLTGKDATEVVLKDSAGKEMVHLRLNASGTDRGGAYVQRVGKEDTIYLTTSQPYLTTDPDGFLKKEILNVAQADIARIEGADFVIARGEGENAALELTAVPPGKKAKASEVNKVTSGLSFLNCTRVFLADDPQVAGLDFNEHLRYELKDTTGYDLYGATRDGRYFLKVQAYHNVEQITFALDEAEAQLKEKADLRARLDDIESFNQFHGSWIYEVNENVMAKLRLRKAQLLENAG